MGTNRSSHSLTLGTRGGVLGSLIFWIVFFGALGYAGYLFLFPYYSFSMIRHQAYTTVTLHGLTDEDIVSKMQTEGRAQGVELGPQNMTLSRTPNPDNPAEGRPRLVISWEQDVEAFGYYVTTLYFDIDTDE